MSRRIIGLLAATSLAGCLASPGVNAPGQTTRDGAPRYHLDAVAACSAAIADVQPSSTKNAYFPASHVVDNNLSTAWAPLGGDAAPALTLSLAGSVSLTAVSVKASRQSGAVPVTFDIKASSDGGATYTTVATGQTSVPGSLVAFPVSATTADHVKLVFGTSDLYVCEVKATGCPTVSPSPSPTGTPTPTPTATPTPEPTATPTPEPTATPTSVPTATPTMTPPPSCADTTGGGYVLGDPDGGTKRANQVAFGFVAHHVGVNQTVQGNIEVNDHRPDGPNFHGDVDTITGSGNTVTFTGTLTGGGTFTCTVVDNGEPGDTDTFSFSTSTGYAISGELGGPEPGGGNIQVRGCDAN